MSEDNVDTNVRKLKNEEMRSAERMLESLTHNPEYQKSIQYTAALAQGARWRSIGQNLVYIGIGLIAIVAWLPHKAGSPIFFAFGAIFILGGLWRIDYAHRLVTKADKEREANSSK